MSRFSGVLPRSFKLVRSIRWRLMAESIENRLRLTLATGTKPLIGIMWRSGPFASMPRRSRILSAT